MTLILTLFIFINVILGNFIKDVTYITTFNSNVKSQQLSSYDTLSYLKHVLGINQQYAYLNESIIELINSDSSSKPKLVLDINGVNIFPDSVTIETNSDINLDHLIKQTDGSKLTNNLQIVNGQSNTFDSFEYQFDKIWLDFKSNNPHYSLTNDKSFMYELSQLIHLNSANVKSDQLYYFQLNSLYSIESKIGSNSQTYLESVKIIEEYIQILEDKFKILIVQSPKKNFIIDFKKRNSNDGFDTKEACELSTSSCNGHGACVETKEKNWNCQCKATFNKGTSKTTYWTGQECNKKDVSVETNLFLWTTIALLVLLVGGIKLMYSIGNTPLPGVLDAATISKKSL